MAAIKIRPRSKQSRFLALDIQDRGKIIAEGRTARSTVQKAEKTGKAFTMFTVPPSGHTLIL